MNWIFLGSSTRPLTMCYSPSAHRALALLVTFSWLLLIRMNWLFDQHHWPRMLLWNGNVGLRDEYDNSVPTHVPFTPHFQQMEYLLFSTVDISTQTFRHSTKSYTCQNVSAKLSTPKCQCQNVLPKCVLQKC